MSCFGGSFPQRRRACSKSLIQVCSALPDDDSDAETESSVPGEDVSSFAPSESNESSTDPRETPTGLLSGSDQVELASSHDSEDQKPLPPTPSPSSPTAGGTPGVYPMSPPPDPVPPYRLEAHFRVLLAAAQRRLEQDRREAERREAGRRDAARRDNERRLQERRDLMAGRRELEGREGGWEEGEGAGAGGERGQGVRVHSLPAVRQGYPHRAPQGRVGSTMDPAPGPLAFPRHSAVAAGHPGYARNGGYVGHAGRRQHPAARSLRRAFATLPLEGRGPASPPHSPFSPSPSSSPVAAAS